MIRMWRISRADPFGLHLWFDPDCEVVSIRPLTDEEKGVRLDMHGSVSGLLCDSDSSGDPSSKLLFHQEELPLDGEASNADNAKGGE